MLTMDPASTVLVTEARGVMGSAIMRRLRAEGFDRTLGPSPLELDMRNPAAVASWFAANRPEYVFHTPIVSGGILANSSRPAEFISTTLLADAAVIQAAHEAGAKALVYVASSCVYPRAGRQPIAEDDLHTGPLEPTSEAYAVAKIAGMTMCRAYRRQYGCRFIPVVPAGVYGPDDDFDTAGAHVVPALIRRFHDARMAGQAEVAVWGSGRPRRDFLHADDLADACLCVMARYDDDRHINVGPGEDLSIRELADEIRAVVYPEARIRFDSSQPDGAPQKLLDVTRLRSLGWRPRVGLRAGLEATHAWFVGSRQAIA